MKLDLVDSLPAVLIDNAIALNVTKGQRLFRKGDRADYLYLIQRGRFQEVSYPYESSMAVLQILNTGETLGESSLLSEVYLSTVIAQTNSQVIGYPKSILLETLGQSPLLMKTAIEILGVGIHPGWLPQSRFPGLPPEQCPVGGRSARAALSSRPRGSSTAQKTGSKWFLGKVR